MEPLSITPSDIHQDFIILLISLLQKFGILSTLFWLTIVKFSIQAMSHGPSSNEEFPEMRSGSAPLKLLFQTKYQKYVVHQLICWPSQKKTVIKWKERMEKGKLRRRSENNQHAWYQDYERVQSWTILIDWHWVLSERTDACSLWFLQWEIQMSSKFLF